MKNKRICLLLAVVLIAGSYCVINLYEELHMYREAEKAYTFFQTDQTEEIVFDAEMKLTYPGMVGIISSGDGLIRYPVMQGKDNEYYLTHMANGQTNALGSVFLDCNARPDFSSAVSVIYGHHVKNDRMFGSLERYKEKAYYETYPVMELYTADGVYEIELIAAYLADGSSETYPPFGADKEEISTFLNSIGDNAFFQSGTTEYQDKNIIILSTCSYEYENARLAVVGVIDRQES